MSEPEPQQAIQAPQSLMDLENLGRRLGKILRKLATTQERKQAALAKVNERYDADISSLSGDADRLVDVIIEYSHSHKPELTDTQTVHLGSMDIEWRTDGKGSLCLLVPEEEVVKRLKRFKSGRDHIVVKESVARASLKADKLTRAKLAGLVDVVYKNVVRVSVLPTPAQRKSGAKWLFVERKQ